MKTKDDIFIEQWRDGYDVQFMGQHKKFKSFVQFLKWMLKRGVPLEEIQEDQIYRNSVATENIFIVSLFSNIGRWIIFKKI